VRTQATKPFVIDYFQSASFFFGRFIQWLWQLINFSLIVRHTRRIGDPCFSICCVSANEDAGPQGIGLKEMQQTKRTCKLYVWLQCAARAPCAHQVWAARNWSCSRNAGPQDRSDLIHAAAHTLLETNLYSLAINLFLQLFFLHGEGPRSRCYGRTTALRLFVQTMWWRWAIFFYQVLQLMERQWKEIDRGKSTNRRKTCPSATLSTTNPTWTDPGSNPGLRSEGRRLTAWAMARPSTAWFNSWRYIKRKD
jgi:hypothetical protein